jgi:hypothetical protein
MPEPTTRPALGGGEAETAGAATEDPRDDLTGSASDLQAPSGLARTGDAGAELAESGGAESDVQPASGRLSRRPRRATARWRPALGDHLVLGQANEDLRTYIATPVIGASASGADLAFGYVDSHASFAVMGATVRGEAAADTGKCGRDAFAIDRVGGASWLLCAVADGVGDSPGSAEASILAVKAALTHFNAYWNAHADSADYVSAVQSIFLRIESDLARRVRRSATTLTALCLELEDPYRFVVGSVGDSPVGLLTERGLVPVFRPKVAGDESVYALPGNTDRLTIATGHLDDGVAAAIVCTDGFGDLLFHERAHALAEYVIRNWTEPVSYGEFLAALDFRLVSRHDDRTAVVIWT